jgi:hypothetical protein
MITIIKDALSERALRSAFAQVACGPFKDEINELDGTVYPLICRHVPEIIKAEIDEICFNHLGRDAMNVAEFFRSSPAGVNCPNPVHHDGVMGDYSLMLYLTNIGGTAFVTHSATGISFAPSAKEVVDIVAADSKNVDSWRVTGFAKADINTAAIFPAQMMHAAHPIGGGGEGVTARVVYTRFFS